MIILFKSYDEPLALMYFDPHESKCICVATNKYYNAYGMMQTEILKPF